MSRLGIIAGGGDLPVRLAGHARAGGREPYVLGITGFADPQFVFDFGGALVAFGEIGRTADLLHEAGCEEVVFAGSVKRPDIGALKFDGKGLLLVPKLLAAAAKGDDALLRVVVGAYESAGFKVIGADDVLGDLLAPAGALGVIAPKPEHWGSIRAAAKTALDLGLRDVGQGAIAAGGETIETEAADGTDAMLARAGKNLQARGGVLVKRAKPQQERRIDLPTIGEATVRNGAAAGLAGIAIEAGHALVLDKAAVAKLADELGLFVYGFAPEELA